MLVTVVLVLLLVEGVLLAAWGWSAHSQRRPTWQSDWSFGLQEFAVQEPAPEIDGEDIEGRPLRLSEYRGQVVVVDFWVHW
jgi:hypothetical protein